MGFSANLLGVPRHRRERTSTSPCAGRIVMPEIEGLELIELGKRGFPDIRIIAVSGGDPQEDGATSASPGWSAPVLRAEGLQRQRADRGGAAAVGMSLARTGRRRLRHFSRTALLRLATSQKCARPASSAE